MSNSKTNKDTKQEKKRLHKQQKSQEEWYAKKGKIERCLVLLSKLDADFATAFIDRYSAYGIFNIIQSTLYDEFPFVAESVYSVWKESKFLHIFVKRFKELLATFALKPLLQEELKVQLKSPANVQNLYYMIESMKAVPFNELEMENIILEAIESHNLVNEFVKVYFREEYGLSSDPMMIEQCVRGIIEFGKLSFVKEALALASNVKFGSSVLNEAYKLYIKNPTEQSKQIFELVKTKVNEFPFQNKLHQTFCTNLPNVQLIDQKQIPDPITQTKISTSLIIPVFVPQSCIIDKYFDPNVASNHYNTTDIVSIEQYQDNYTKTLMEQLNNQFDVDIEWYKNQIHYLSTLSKNDKFSLFQFVTSCYRKINLLLNNDDSLKTYIYDYYSDLQQWKKQKKIKFQIASDSNKEIKQQIENETKNPKQTDTNTYVNKRTQIETFIENQNEIDKQSDFEFDRIDYMNNKIDFFVEFCQLLNLPTTTNSEIVLQRIKSLSEKDFFNMYIKAAKVMIDNISNIINNSPPTTKPFYVYRGTNKDVYNAMQSNNQQIKSNSFVSTSLSLDVATKYIVNESKFNKEKSSSSVLCCLNVFHVKPGTKCLFVEPLSGQSNNIEVLFNLNQPITIDQIGISIPFQESSYHEFQKHKNFTSNYDQKLKKSFATFPSQVCNSRQLIMKVNKLAFQ